MRYWSHTPKAVEEMLEVIGVDSIDKLFSSIAPSLKLSEPSDNGLGEFEVISKMRKIGQNNHYSSLKNYAGCGSYEHQIPSLVSAICGRGEFLTTYTPYQAEASQGLLQAIFEFQSVISQLTGCDIANASMYDGASAAAEALLLACRCHPNAKKVLVSQGVHPHIREVIHLYFSGLDIEVKEFPLDASRTISCELLRKELDDTTAACLIASPNVYGLFEEDKHILDIIKSNNSISIFYGLPHAMAFCHAPGSLGADIVCGDLQPVAVPMNFGGPYVGYIAAKKEFMRQMPGRLVSMTKDSNGDRAYTLTLQTREQHIRREKATSNICSNQALAALASLIILSWYGAEGLQNAAIACYRRAHYLAKGLGAIPGVKVMRDKDFFHEFIIELPLETSYVIQEMARQGIYPGVNLLEVDGISSRQMLIAVTEVKSKDDLDDYVKVLKGVLSGNSL